MVYSQTSCPVSIQMSASGMKSTLSLQYARTGRSGAAQGIQNSVSQVGTLVGYLVIVASDASDHTWRRAKSFVAGTNQVAVKVPFTKDEMGQAIGRESLAIAAFTDPAMALAFVKALPGQGQYTEQLQALENRTQRVRQRQQEAKAHEKNKRMGKAAAGVKKR